MATLPMGSHVLHYEDDGPLGTDAAGDPVVLAHSLPGNSWFWREWVPVLGAGRRVVRFDLRGINGSTLPPDGRRYTVDDLVDDYVGLLDGLGLARVHHVGIATGANLGVACAARHPDRFASLTLMSAAPFIGRAPSRLVDFTRSQGNAEEPTEVVRRIGLREWYLRTGQATNDRYGDERDLECADAFARTPVANLLALWECIHRPDVDLTESAPLVRAPALVLFAEKAASTTLVDQQWLADALPDARLRTFPGWGSRMWFHHADVLSRTTREFIETVERRAP